MRWPWQAKPSSEQLVLSWHNGELAYVLASAPVDGVMALRQAGVIAQTGDNPDQAARPLLELGFKGLDTTLMLSVDQYQLLQIDTPNVPPEELRSAARYQVRDMLQTHVDDVTIDVMRVGDGRQQGSGHSFVVAAPNAEVARVTALAQAIDAQLSVIDIQETAQRNLQNTLAQHDGVLDRANAALVLVEGQQAVLTISLNEELFYTRRFDVPEGFLTAVWGQGVLAAPPEVDGFTPVQEYVPQHGGGDISLDSVFLAESAAPPNAATAPQSSVTTPNDDDDKAQRLVLEVQRSLDVWDRTWSSLPLNRVRVFAGPRSAELASWLTLQLGQTVTAVDIMPVFTGLEALAAADLARCFPLLGVLLRSDALA
ncbi:MAG: hypothetical protein AUJ20_13740 [Comamonadaceae bacterium CG1_02_60_18]|nr:MAG: hypothetical protein AUJ20_13740 [Comamonadaceae bacterium CG1_02_60_18]PIQ55875.1 MAG: hypothetical protein COW02_02145 [Comamonadaceae bacterium CG12_big_fil_rev_8_21_14_0_65_59_15]